MNDPVHSMNDTQRRSVQPDADQPQYALSIRQILFGGIGFMLFFTVIIVGINILGVERLQQFIADSGIFAPVVYIIIKALTYIFAPLTSGPIQVIAGALFGNIWLGTLYTLIGEVLGGSVNFWIGRTFGQPVVKRLVGEKGMTQIENIYANQLGGWVSLAIARVVLFGLWDFLSYTAGLARNVRFISYFLVSVIMGAIPTFFFVWMGSAAVNDTSAMVLIYGLVAAMILIPIAGRKTIASLMQWAVNLNQRKSKSKR